jgi:hypothetical protein
VVKDRDHTEAVITALLVSAFIVVFVVDIRPVGKAREFISRAKILHALGPETSLQSIVSPPPEAPGRFGFWTLERPLLRLMKSLKRSYRQVPLRDSKQI